MPLSSQADLLTHCRNNAQTISHFKARLRRYVLFWREFPSGEPWCSDCLTILGLAAMGSPAQGNATVMVYESHTAVEATVRELQRFGFDMRKVSVASRYYHVDRGNDPAKSPSSSQTFWTAMWRVLSEWDFFAIPDVGLVFVAGPLAGWAAAGLGNAELFGGLSALGAGLYSIGIPKTSILRYEAALKEDKFLLVAHGSTSEVNHAREILARVGGSGTIAA